VGWDAPTLDRFDSDVRRMLAEKRWTKVQLVELFNKTLSRFSHRETFKYLDDRM